nr:unnamed protein product [Callosobruchus chinensis]
MFVIEFSAPAEVNIVSKEEEKRTKYQDLSDSFAGFGQTTLARKFFSPSNLLTLYEAQIRPSLEYCSHIWGAAAPTTLSILDAVQRRAIQLIGDPALTCHLQLLSHRRAVGDLSLFYRKTNQVIKICRHEEPLLIETSSRIQLPEDCGVQIDTSKFWNKEGGSKKGVAGCRDNLLIDCCVTQDSVHYKRNLSMTWIDYRKAFDTTSIDSGCIKQLMPLWKTRFTITSSETRVRTELVSFKRGVFQGDSLSPLLFCISLLPLSIALKNTKGYSCGAPNRRMHKVTHLFYMDDLKLYASAQRDLQHLLSVVQDYSHAIGMEFKTDKRRGDSGEEDQLVDGSILRQLHAGDTYTYLGVAQSHIQEAKIVKECLRRKYLHRLRQIWSSELSGKNKVAATNMLAVQLLLYTFGAIHWTVEELRQLDTKTRKRMNMERSLHPKSSVPRIYLPRHLGGRGLLSLERLHNRVVLATACYVTRSTDPLICFVREHEKAGKGAFLFKAAIRAADELSLAIDFTRRCQRSITVLAPAQLKTHIKAAEVEFLLKLHKDKQMHGIFYKHLEEHGLSQQLTFSFPRSSGLKSETEGFIMACQDGVFNTLVYRSRVMGVNVPDGRCRACRQAPETLMYLLSAWDIESVVESERCRIYWNYSFPTLELVQANKPDIVLLDHQQKTMFVIEFSAPAEVNIVSKEGEKRTKYQDLLGQLRRLWADYTVSLLVMVMGFLGGMRNTLLSALRAMPVTKAVRKVLQSLDINKTTSPDMIPAVAAKKCAPEHAILTRLFRMPYSSGVFLKDWKSACIQPVPEKGSKADPSNYRTIALLSVIGKVMEK